MPAVEGDEIQFGIVLPPKTDGHRVGNWVAVKRHGVAIDGRGGWIESLIATGQLKTA